MADKDEQVVDQEYQEEFEKLAAGEEPSKKEDPKPEEKKDEKAPDPEKEPEKSGDDEPKTGEPEQEGGAEPKGDDAGLVKALKDTKAWATKIAMEKANLEKELAALKAGGADKEKVEAAKNSLGELDDKIKKASEDYPELKDVLDLQARTVKELTAKLEKFEKLSEEESKRLEAQAHFEKEVAPEIAKVHPDWKKVAFSDEYMAWLKTQSPATQYAAMRSLDPEDICGTLDKFKKFKAGPEAEKAKQEEAERKKGLKANLSSMRGGGAVSKEQGKAKKFEELNPDDREGAFEFLASQEPTK